MTEGAGHPQHAFLALPGKDRAPGWTTRCVFCGEGPNHSNHDVPNDQNAEMLLKAISGDFDAN